MKPYIATFFLCLFIGQFSIFAEGGQIEQPKLDKQNNDICVVDMMFIFQNALAVESVRAQISKVSEKITEELSKYELQLKSQEEELLQNKHSLSPIELDKALRKFNKELTSMQRHASEQKRKLEYIRSETMQKIDEAIKVIISDMSKEYYFKLAIPKTHMLYVGDNIEITEEVLRRLNHQMQAIEINFE